MTLATCSGARGPLLSQSWSKSKGGMFEILHLLFWKNVRRHGKNWSNTIKYIWKSSSGSELYRGISVFIPRRQENIKKQYRNKVEKWRVSEARPLIIPSCTKNLLLSHLKDVKAKIEQKSINNMKLPFEGPFKDKYAGRSPERILCLYSVRLVWVTKYTYLK